MKTDLKGLDAQETESWVEDLGLEAYRGRQIRQWLFKKLVHSFDEMTDLSAPLRDILKEKARINVLEKVKTQVSKDTTEKYLFRLNDGLYIESVLIPERDHYTLCISSQAGCAMGCAFCLTSRQGFNRNLTPSEIVEQVIIIKRKMEEPDRLTNIVLMGMGEPLANYENVIKALNNITAEDGMNFSHRKVTLSTCGIVPMMAKLGRDTTVNLAVSLNAADDKTRSYLMPVNRKYGLKSLIGACRKFPLPNRRMITFEYILINGINDGSEDARKLVRLLSGLRAKINLIPLNSGSGLDMKEPSPEKIIKFQEIFNGKSFHGYNQEKQGPGYLCRLWSVKRRVIYGIRFLILTCYLISICYGTNLIYDQGVEGL